MAPKKTLSIPKLELQAAVLKSRLSLVVIKEHDYIIDILISGQTAALCFSGFVECLNGTPPLSLIELVRSWIQLAPVNEITV